MKLVLLDSYDSFTWNLVDYLERTGASVEVLKNDATTVANESFELADGLVLSPGPKRPEDAGILLELIGHYVTRKPILGVCLGHQALGLHFGMHLIEAPEPVHGRTSFVQHDESGLFDGLPNPLAVMRYHSLILDKKNISNELVVQAETAEGLIMAIRHATLPVYGVQFHPESILTEGGQTLLANWVEEIKKRKKS